MVLPCFTEAVDIVTNKRCQHPEFLFVLCGKEDDEYLSGSYSPTDAKLGEAFTAVLSTYLPRMRLPEKQLSLLDKLDSRALEEFELAWLADLAREYLPGLHSIGIYPEFPSEDLSSHAPDSFQIVVGTAVLVQNLRGCCAARSVGSKTDLHCLVESASTNFQSNRQLVFAFANSVIPIPQVQLLDLLVEHARNALSAVDFREYHLETQAQIRHVIRGTLSAAISEIELIESRHRLFSGMPTKLARLLQTPTMEDSMADAALWLNEAYALADAPRYLLDSFSAQSIRWSDVDPFALVQSVLDISRGETRRRGLRVAFDKKGELPQPDAPEHWLVSADPQFLKIVVFNLIDNAIKFSFQDRRLVVRLSRNVKAGTWRFEVENIGVPISEDEKHRIFQPWVRLYTPFAHRRPGTGLGLAVSKRILLAHDERAVFDCTSPPIREHPPMAKTTFFFEMALKGKGGVRENNTSGG